MYAIVGVSRGGSSRRHPLPDLEDRLVFLHRLDHTKLHHESEIIANCLVLYNLAVVGESIDMCCHVGKAIACGLDPKKISYVPAAYLQYHDYLVARRNDFLLLVLQVGKRAP